MTNGVDEVEGENPEKQRWKERLGEIRQLSHSLVIIGDQRATQIGSPVVVHTQGQCEYS